MVLIFVGEQSTLTLISGSEAKNAASHGEPP